MARDRGNKKKDKRAAGPGGPGVIETVLAPVAALVVIAAAAVRAVLDRHGGDRPGAAQPPPPAAGPAVAANGDDKRQRGLKAKLDKLGERFKPLGAVLRVQQRYSEVRGNNIASAVTLQAFLSLFPLILVVVAVVGFVSAGDGADVAGRIISALGLDGDAARAVNDAVATAEKSRRTASVAGLAGLLWSGLGLVNALQYAFNQVWQVEERGIKDKAVGILWLGGAAVVLVGSSALTRCCGGFPASSRRWGSSSPWP